ncbi:MAG: hypothetical protein IKK57_01880, partial [Clostridia bacterium]|nr:hypothetical protein [Clostridia bacterium]
LKAKVKPDANKAQNKLRLEYIAKLQEANGYADSADLYNQACYEHAVALTKLGDYRGAMEYYSKCGAYEDAAAKAEALHMQVIRQLIDERNYTEAYNQLTAMADNAEAQELLATESHMVAYKALADQLQKGSKYAFGRYEQDGSRSNGAEPIEWVVLTQTEDGRVLLLSDKVLTHHDFGKSVKTWPGSAVQKWLNGEFASEAFYAEEMGALIETALDNAMPGNATWGSAAEVSYDRVFLLSLGEAITYFDTYEASRTTATPHAQATYPYSNRESINSWLTRSTNTQEPCVCLLPLTELSADKTSASFSTTQLDAKRGIRPAVWVSIGELVSINTAVADGRALMESGNYAAALNALMYSTNAESAQLQKEANFRYGETAMAAGEYADACARFELAYDYEGAAQRLQEARYALAAEQEAAAEYTAAIENYTLAGDYSDAAQRVSICHYKNGMALLESKTFDAAVEALTQAGDTENAKEMILRAYYEKAEKLEAEGDYEAAAESFKLAEG